VNHHTSPSFWTAFEELPRGIQELARANYELLRKNPRHPSLHFKKVGGYWSVRVGIGYRALGTDVEDGVLWAWIGTHAEYDRMI
jgi:hypothetical protein